VEAQISVFFVGVFVAMDGDRGVFRAGNREVGEEARGHEEA